MDKHVQNEVRFVPSVVEGIEGVREIVVRTDRLEVNVDGEWKTFFFAEIGRPSEARWRSRLKRLLGIGPWPLVVGERDCCLPAGESYFRWYTDPPLTTYTPLSEAEVEEYGKTLSAKINVLLARSNFMTFDMG